MCRRGRSVSIKAFEMTRSRLRGRGPMAFAAFAGILVGRIHAYSVILESCACLCTVPDGAQHFQLRPCQMVRCLAMKLLSAARMMSASRGAGSSLLAGRVAPGGFGAGHVPGLRTLAASSVSS
jgi:hypothetical protein